MLPKTMCAITESCFKGTAFNSVFPRDGAFKFPWNLALLCGLISVYGDDWSRCQYEAMGPLPCLGAHLKSA